MFEDDEGRIPVQDLRLVMVGLDLSPTQDSIDALVKIIDYNADGRVDFDEFTVMMIKILAEAEKDRETLVEVFKRFDKDGDGAISWKDLHAMFTELGHKMEEKEAQDMILQFDQDDNQ